MPDRIQTAASKARGIEADPYPSWLTEHPIISKVGSLITGGATDPGAEMGPVDLLGALTGLLASGKLAKMGYDHLMNVGEPVPNSIARDPFALKKGPTDRRQFMYRASTQPAKAAKQEYAQGFSKVLGADPESGPIGGIIDKILSGAGPLPDDEKALLTEAISKYVDQGKLARRIDSKYKITDPKLRASMGDGWDEPMFSDAGSLLDHVLMGNSGVDPSLGKKLMKALDTDSLINSHLNEVDYQNALASSKGTEKPTSSIIDDLFRRIGVRK